jgi:recombination protein RecT
MTEKNLPAPQGQPLTLAALLGQENIKSRFESVLGKKAAGFMSSIISAVNANPELKKADQMSVVAAAAVAASLDLPINPSLGFAHLVPYKRDGVPIAQFQMGWRGFVQLGMRSGQYRTLNVCEVYEGELVEGNRFTGEMHFDEKKRTSDKIIGYVAYFKLLNGFEKYLYMTEDQVTAHGKKYSKSYDNKNSMWQKDAGPMKLKTVLKMLISKFGILSIEMQTAVQLDQAVMKNMDGSYEYVDNPETDSKVIDAESEDIVTDPAAAIKVFDESIPKDINAEILTVFLTRTAEGNRSTIDAVKISGAADLKTFWKIARAFEKQEKAKMAKKSKQEKKDDTKEMAKAECPENPGTTYQKEHCDKCEKREGCPAWE